MDFGLMQMLWVFTGALVYLGCGMCTANFFRNSIIRQMGEERAITTTIAKWGLILTWPIILGVICVLAALVLALIIFLIELFPCHIYISSQKSEVLKFGQ